MIRHGIAALAALAWAAPAPAATPEEVLALGTRLALELVRHTPTYSPPVASRAFAYLHVAAYEATASGDAGLVTLAGQLAGLGDVPAREPGAHDEAAVLQATDAAMLAALFANTGPAGQRALAAVDARLEAEVAEGLHLFLATSSATAPEAAPTAATANKEAKRKATACIKSLPVRGQRVWR